MKGLKEHEYSSGVKIISFLCRHKGYLEVVTLFPYLCLEEK
jgi:hypothetical protein